MLSSFEQILLLLSFFGLMIGIGASIEKKDLTQVLENKQHLWGGLTMQYLLLPSLAALFSFIFKLPPLIGWTLVLIAACPGGSTSNMFTYFSKGNVSLSLFLTFITTLCSVFMTPLLLFIFAAHLQTTHSISLPLINLAATLSMALIPVLIGFGIRTKSEYWALKVEKTGSLIGYISIITMVILWYPKTKEIIQTQDLTVFFVTWLLSFSGIVLTLGLSLLSKASLATARTLSFETGIQNAPLAFAIISLNLPKELALGIGWVPLVYGALSVTNAAVFTLIYRVTFKGEHNLK